MQLRVSAWVHKKVLRMAPRWALTRALQWDPERANKWVCVWVPAKASQRAAAMVLHWVPEKDAPRASDWEHARVGRWVHLRVLLMVCDSDRD
jgi:hypothetical protein